jgi:hypothetical protein
MLGFWMHWNRSRGTLATRIASRITRTISKVVPFERGCGEKITASRHFQRVDAGVRRRQLGLVVGTSEAITPAGFAYLTMPLAAFSSMMPVLFWRSAVAQHAEDLHALGLRPSGSPRPLSSTLIATMRAKVLSLAVAQPSA